MPLVSVIVPNYNHARFLAKRLRSILDQTLQDIEVLYLDDASTDNSAQVFESFAADPRVRSVVNKTNSGCTFKQWNRGIGSARGQYVWIAESDDFADLRLLETLVSRLDQHPSVGLVYCQSQVVDEHDACQGVLELTDLDFRRIGAGHWEHDYVNSGRHECERFLARGNTIANASAVVFRRSVAERIGPADESFRVAGDWMFWARMLLVSDIAFVAEPLNYFRRHGGTVRVDRTRDGSLIEESYRVVSYLAGELALDESVLEPTRELYCGQWLCETRRLGIGLRRHLAIARAARRLDQRLAGRLARTALTCLHRRFGR